MRRVAVLVLLVGALGEAPALHASPETGAGMPQRYGCTRSDPERPYVCDVGAPRPLALRSFKQIFRSDASIRALVARIGMPDYVELQKIDVNGPWVSWELRTYYRDYDKMFVFGRALILGNPEVSLMRHEGPIPPGKFAPPPRQPVAVANDAVGRAEEAAQRAEMEAERAERYAGRADSAAAGADENFQRELLKH